MAAPRRLMATAYAASEKVYSFRFDSPMKNSTTKIGVGHFSDVGLRELVCGIKGV